MDLVEAKLLTQSPKINLVENLVSGSLAVSKGISD